MGSPVKKGLAREKECKTPFQSETHALFLKKLNERANTPFETDYCQYPERMSAVSINRCKREDKHPSLQPHHAKYNQPGEEFIVKTRTDRKPCRRTYVRRWARDEALAANAFDSIVTSRGHACILARANTPRTISTQCLKADQDIAATVTDAIACITTVPKDALRIGVQNGWVILNGTLGDLAQRATVEHVVLHSAGVRGVVNSIKIGAKPIPKNENISSTF